MQFCSMLAIWLLHCCCWFILCNGKSASPLLQQQNASRIGVDAARRQHSVTYFIAETEADIASLPSSPSVIQLSVHGFDYSLRLTNEYRLIKLRNNIEMETSQRMLYCRVPIPLRADELLEREHSRMSSTALLSATRGAIMEWLMSLDCMKGEGDRGVSEVVHTYKYCPLGGLWWLPTKNQSRSMHAVNNDPQQLTPSRDDDADVATVDAGLSGDDDGIPDRKVLLGIYKESAKLKWNEKLYAWELRLVDGGLCARDSTKRYRSRVLFRCHRADNVDTSKKVVWLVTQHKERCEVTVELETSAVCAWHTAISKVYQCPIPCLQVE